MNNKLKDKHIKGTALEMIMKDVLRGMVDFTHDACTGCDAARLEIIAVEQTGNDPGKPSNVVRFPRPPKSR